jgi:hypothetical protein
MDQGQTTRHSFIGNRRDFAKTLAVLTAPLITGQRQAVADEPKTAPPELLLTAGQALAEAVRARYGKYLTIDELAQIRASIDRNQQAAQRLSQVKLKNGDEPAFVFSVDTP